MEDPNAGERSFVKEEPSMDIGRRLVEDEKDVFEVEAITGMKEVNGKMYYKVRWTGYQAKESTWEPEENLLTCMDMVETYVQSKLAKQKAKQDALEIYDKPIVPKDTFWKDFEEGRINVFEQDMYSRVKKARSQKHTSNSSDSSQSKDYSKEENSINLSKRKHNILQTNLTYSFQRKKTKKQNIIPEKVLIRSSSDTTVPNSTTQDSVVLLQDFSAKNESMSLPVWKLKRHKNKDTSLNIFQRSHVISTERLLQKAIKANRTKGNESNWSLNCSVLVENIKYSNIPLNLGSETRMIIKNSEEGYKITTCDAKSRLYTLDSSISSPLKNDPVSHQVKENDSSAVPKQESSKEIFKTTAPSIHPMSIASQKFCINIKNGDNQKTTKPNEISWNDQQVVNNAITPLVLSVLKGDVEEAKRLINQGEDVNLQLKSGHTALMFACEKGDIKMVLALLDMGAQKELKNSKGETALIMASRKGHFDVVKELLDRGANFSVCNNEGMTALRVSAAAAQTAVRNLLNNHITRIKYAFEAFINKLLKGSSCKVLHALFPLHCFTLNEGPDLYITFCHGVPSEMQGAGDLIFITYMSVSAQEVTCFMNEPCFVLSVTLNGVQQSPMTEGTNFILSFKPLRYGTNEAVIHTAPSPQHKNFKLVVCAFRTELEDLPEKK